MSKNSLHPDTNPEKTTETCRVCKGTCFVPLSDDPAVIGVGPCSFCNGLGWVTKPDFGSKGLNSAVSRPVLRSKSENSDHWAVQNPGLADQFRNEARACRKLLGFDPDGQDISPSDLMEAIENLMANKAK